MYRDSRSNFSGMLSRLQYLAIVYVTVKITASLVVLKYYPFQSNYISGVYDAATIKLSNISNTGQFDEAWNKNESVIR